MHGEILESAKTRIVRGKKRGLVLRRAQEEACDAIIGAVARWLADEGPLMGAQKERLSRHLGVVKKRLLSKIGPQSYAVYECKAWADEADEGQQPEKQP